MFGQPAEQRVTASAVISPAVVREVSFDHGNDVGDRNFVRLPVGRDLPEREGWAKAMPRI
jgi:hypothetical protein